MNHIIYLWNDLFEVCLTIYEYTGCTTDTQSISNICYSIHLINSLYKDLQKENPFVLTIAMSQATSKASLLEKCIEPPTFYTGRCPVWQWTTLNTVVGSSCWFPYTSEIVIVPHFCFHRNKQRGHFYSLQYISADCCASYCLVNSNLGVVSFVVRFDTSSASDKGRD